MQRPARAMPPKGLLIPTLVAALVVAGGAQAAPQRWTHLTTTAGYSLDQPMGWMSIATAPDRVDIVSRGCHQAGVTICDGEAEITVRSEAVVAKPKVLKSKACWS